MNEKPGARRRFDREWLDAPPARSAEVARQRVLAQLRRGGRSAARRPAWLAAAGIVLVAGLGAFLANRQRPAPPAPPAATGAAHREAAPRTVLVRLSSGTPLWITLSDAPRRFEP